MKKHNFNEGVEFPLLHEDTASSSFLISKMLTWFHIFHLRILKKVQPAGINSTVTNLQFMQTVLFFWPLFAVYIFFITISQSKIYITKTQIN